MSVLKIRDENGNFIPISTIKGEKGDTGEKGDVGYTPQKGVDYFTEEDIEYIKELVADDDIFVKQVECISTDNYLLGKVYVVDKNNVQTTMELKTIGQSGTIPLRNARANFEVGTPTLVNECTPKKYVDGLVADFVTEERVTELIEANKPNYTEETWTFTLEDGSTVTKTVVLK